MKKFAKPTAHSRYDSDYRFTAHKHYEILGDYGSRVDIEDDSGKLVTVRVDSVRSGRLDNGRFDVVYKVSDGSMCVGSMSVAVEVDTKEAQSAIDKLQAKDIERLREILRCPAGESIFQHAYAVRAIADLTLERLNQK